MRRVLKMTVALSMTMAEPTTVKDLGTNLIWEDGATDNASENYDRSIRCVSDIK